jgi:acyl-CoA thioester hydrolase
MNKNPLLTISDYSTIVELPVQWGDMDAMQHVNNLMYIRYFESSRIQYFIDHLKIGITPSNMGPILAEIQCKYKFPLTYPDTVISATRPILETLDTYSIDIEQIVISKNHNRIAAEGIAKIVFYDYIAGKKAAIPPHLIEAIRTSVR